uniref:Ig-like domain-containing protein n=1 Tax=Ornithorhynchus anatinus TaxID=9258 RepID=A0A6I8NFU6_ORNAN
MLGSITLLLAAPLPGGQTALTLEQPTVTITRKTGSAATFICEFSDKSIKYIHWYRQQEGKAPRRLLYYNLVNSQPRLDTGFNSNKIHAYKINDQSCTLKVQKLDPSDAAIYYCAGWDSTVTQFPPCLNKKLLVCGHREQGLPPTDPTVNLTPCFSFVVKLSGASHWFLAQTVPNRRSFSGYQTEQPHLSQRLGTEHCLLFHCTLPSV